MDSLIIRPLSYSGFGRQNANQMREGNNINTPTLPMSNLNGIAMKNLLQPYQIHPTFPVQSFSNQPVMNHPHEKNFTTKATNKQL